MDDHPTDTRPGAAQRFLRMLWFAAPLGVGAALCLWVLVLGIGVTAACQWPGEWDTLRDIGMAQTILDGRYPEDPILLGETLWYNPLTGVIIALAGVTSGLPLPRASVLIGPYVNLIAPVFFIVLMSLLFGRYAALAGVCLFLFGKDPHRPFWVYACYSPWMLAPLYSLGFLFATLALYYHALVKRSIPGFLGAGLLLGITFMSHTAPALVAGAVILTGTAVEAGLAWWRGAPRSEINRLLIGFLLLLGIAFVVSLPFTWSILKNYRFRVLNPWPSLYAADHVALQYLPLRLREALNWHNGLAAVGLIALACRLRRDPAARMALCWTLIALAFMGQHYAWQFLLKRGIVLTAFVPGHHGAIHLSTVRAILFGVGVVALGTCAARGLGYLRQWATGTPWTPAFLGGVREAARATVVVVAGTALYMAQPLAQRVDFAAPDRDGYHQLHERKGPMYDWILENTRPDAVFLCEAEDVGLTVVMPAARKLVSTMLLYSNPYVNPSRLGDAQRMLLDAIAENNREAFCDAANAYPKLFLLLREPVDPGRLEVLDPFFQEEHRAGGLIVFAARPCPNP